MFIWILFLSLGCQKASPTFNPFDDVFDVAVNRIGKCDTISAGCGYFNLTKDINGVNVYYQVFVEDFEQVVAKGLSIKIDTLCKSTVAKLETDNCLAVCATRPFDTLMVIKKLETFGVKVAIVKNSPLRFDFLHPKTGKKTQGYIDCYYDDSLNLIRHLTVWEMPNDKSTIANTSFDAN
jgi:hypothetical protein